MKVVTIEPFFGQSHKLWCEGLRDNSSHQIEILSLPGRHWKWRMHGAAITLATQFVESSKTDCDLIIASDFIDLALFKSLISRDAQIPLALYFHENQFAYPWSETDEDKSNGRDVHYQFTNYSSGLIADHLFFNSSYNMNSYLEGIERMLLAFPDYKNMSTVKDIANKSSVLPLGVDLGRFDSHCIDENVESVVPIILWNHRWEYDKNPDLFFNSLFRLKSDGVPFKLIVTGESFGRCPIIFDRAKDILRDEIIHFGHVDSFEQYARYLWMADIAFITSNQDFFGISVVESIYTDCYPILPNRLAYPEHISTQHKDCFYQSDPYPRLKQVIEEKKYKESYRACVERYDWNRIIKLYDDQLSKLISI